MRGSPHIHALFWVDKAPKIDKDSDAKVLEFCDKYVTCQMPSDPELLDLIDVQKHSEYHTKSCDKNNAKKQKKGEIHCKFNFPRPVSERKFITRLLMHNLRDNERLALKKVKGKFCQTSAQDESSRLLRNFLNILAYHKKCFKRQIVCLPNGQESYYNGNHKMFG